MTDGPVVTRTITVGADPGDVWETLADPTVLSRWLGGEARLAVRPGGTGRYVGDDGEARLCVVEEVEPGQRLVFCWWPVRRPGDGPPGPYDRSRVTITLDPDAGGTTVTVEERVVPVTRPVGKRAMGMSLRPGPRRSGWRRGPEACLTGPGVGAPR